MSFIHDNDWLFFDIEQDDYYGWESSRTRKLRIVIRRKIFLTISLSTPLERS